jgi:phosphoribosylaminoimidazole carboxylase PurE protein
MSDVVVSIVMGSDSDWPVMEQCAQVLDDFGVGYDVRVCSAHRSPQAVHEFASTARDRGVKVIIACAGMSAALAGCCAAVTTLPVIGVPTSSGMLDGLDALLSTAQLPPGVAVAAMGLDKPGARNAGLLAVQMLSLAEAGLADKLAAYKQKLADGVAKKNAKLQEKLKGRG